MKRLFSFLFCLTMVLFAYSQEVYISNSRDVSSDEIADKGTSGFLILSKSNDLVINVANSKKKVQVFRRDDLYNGFYQYEVIVDAADTQTPKVQISRRGQVYKTEIVQTMKDGCLLAYRVEEVSHPIRIDFQGNPNDAHLNAAEAELELTSTIKNLNIKCSPRLEARITSKVSPVDPNVMLTSVIFPVAVLKDAQKLVAETSAAYTKLDEEITQLYKKGVEVPQEKFTEMDALVKAKEDAEKNYMELIAISIFADDTNQLTLDIADYGPRTKKSYVVVPLVIEKDVFVTECSSFMAEGARLFQNRKYKEAQAAYQSAWEAKDVVGIMRPAIRESIAECDSCMQYENLAARAMIQIKKMQENKVATQEEVVKYVSAVVQFMEVLDQYNPCEFYKVRIEKLSQKLGDLPLELKFKIVEWKTFHEGENIPGVEVWAYYGNETDLAKVELSDRKFAKLMEKERSMFVQLGLTDENGVSEVKLNRRNLPVGVFFRPQPETHIHIKYMNFNDIAFKSKGTYLKKQIRLKMFTPQ